MNFRAQVLKKKESEKSPVHFTLKRNEDPGLLEGHRPDEQPRPAQNQVSGIAVQSAFSGLSKHQMAIRQKRSSQKLTIESPSVDMVFHSVNRKWMLGISSPGKHVLFRKSRTWHSLSSVLLTVALSYYTVVTWKLMPPNRSELVTSWFRIVCFPLSLLI